ncbi:Uncharacterised protein [Legionella lansingensis]|uniref:Uncharacterized protein n=1 Tax=Legionella lansingensis TaxID=45067 RepID=A0A0W0VUC5_9GAMM|nr:hypothetical protein [Legionella lansingensis]KTD23799.1 hypothetical protein Llan_0580 [Legionella lansingensis]SNV47011.1 Uncharacterised protein [Legionella lansingensis]
MPKEIDSEKAKKIREDYANKIADLKAENTFKEELLTTKLMDIHPQIRQKTYSISNKNSELVRPPQKKQVTVDEKVKEEEDKNKKPPIFLTTWEDTSTNKLLAYSISIGGMGSTVHDVSHLNITRSEFMSIAVPLVLSASSSSVEKLLQDKFPSCRTYASFDEYEKSLQSRYNTPFKLTPNPF